MKNDMLPTWLHLEQIHTNIADVLRAAKALGALISTIGQESVETVVATLERLQEKCRRGKWTNRTLSDMSDFAADASQVDPRLVRFSGRLAVQLKESLELLEWLRTMPNDTDFGNSIEVALNRTEMECPPELWEEAEGRVGRPDEQKLSQLSTTRSYFRDIIFRAVEYPDSFQELLDVIGLPAFSRGSQQLDKALSCLTTTNELRLPLMELLAEDGESSAPDRLLQLLSPPRKAIFSIKFDLANFKPCDRGTNGLQFLLVCTICVSYVLRFDQLLRHMYPLS